jgi:isoquinoline 1-oxidoreductase beta subunit
MNQMPALDIQILDSRAMPGGYGEHPVPPVAPAVANAVFAATGKRIRALPITPDTIRG